MTTLPIGNEADKVENGVAILGCCTLVGKSRMLQTQLVEVVECPNKTLHNPDEQSCVQHNETRHSMATMKRI